MGNYKEREYYMLRECYILVILLLIFDNTELCNYYNIVIRVFAGLVLLEDNIIRNIRNTTITSR